MTTSRAKPSAAASSAAATAFRKYAPALHRYLLRRMRRSADVEDLAQEVFERYLRVAQMDTVRNPQSYLYGIATHVVADARLREEHTLLSYDSEMAEEAATRANSAAVDTLADQVGFAQELQRGIEQLPDMHKAVLLLAVRDGWSHREVAERTGLTEKTVGFYVCEAKARLRAILKPEQEG